MELPWLFVCLFVSFQLWGNFSDMCHTFTAEGEHSRGLCGCNNANTTSRPRARPGGALLESAAMPGHPSQEVGGMSKPVSCMRLHARAPDCPD